MQISPPFLPARAVDESEDDWLDRCMAGGAAGDGAYPVSFNLAWHGGMHLKAPRDGASFEPVRAIADGTVVFRRDPSSPPAESLPEDHAQAYNGGWTDNGVVVIRHDTEIGDGSNASVTFFSIYMHLNAIDATVSTTVRGGRIFRKAEIGHAGQIYGSVDRRIHFEIVCNDDNLTKLVGRASGERSLDSDGRTDSVYGAMYVLLPAGTHVFAEKPLPNSAAAMTRPAPTPGHPHPAPVACGAVHATADEIVIALRTAAGEGVDGHRGSVFVQTYRLDGSTIGAEIEEANGEYDFYTRAKAISESYPSGARPAASAVYELLRFGRVIGSDSLVPADVPCWRQIRHDGSGVGWVNLNASRLRKFSDADFPQWRSWRLMDDSADRDSRCDSAAIRGWLDRDGDGTVRPHEASMRLADEQVAPKLARVICKFATEWDASRVDAQWTWLKTETPENPKPLSDEDFARLRAHLNALQFWPGGTGLPVLHWHFPPKEFVRQFRKCGWLTAGELVQLLPGDHPLSFNQMRTRLIAGVSGTTQTLPGGLNIALNLVCRKYVLESAIRRAHFWGQAAQETDQLQTVREYASGLAYENRPDLGNTGNGDGVRFRGRGVIQMTGRSNYARYGVYRGSNFTTEPNNLLLQTEAYAACDASTFYWVAEHTRDRVNGHWILDGLVGISRRADLRTFRLLTDAAAVRNDVSRVTRQVNRAELHLERRIRYFTYAYLDASDSIESFGHGNLRP